VILYWRGQYLNEAEAFLPVEELYFQGSALAEAFRVSSGRVPLFKEHGARLKEGARALCMPEPDLKELKKACAKLIRLNRLKEGGLRLRYFRSGELLIHPLASRPKSKGPLRLLTTAVRHYGPESLQARVKGSSMLANWLAQSESRTWAEDGLRLTQDGYVMEGVWSNLVIQRRGLMLSPPLAQGSLEGTTRSALLKSWRAKGGKVRISPLTRHDLYSADKVWVCSALRGAQAVDSVDGRKIGNKA
jgi:branched-chain amino acid aminotransferase